MAVSTAPILAVDTATDVCSVALALGADIFESIESVGQRHSERVLPMIDALLRAHRIALADCAALAFGAGPGSFTGLRIACGVVQGLAWSADKPVVAVGNLAALALAASVRVPQARRIAAAIDARMDEIYWAIYDMIDAQPVEIVAPALAPAAAIAMLLAPHQPGLIAGTVDIADRDLAADRISLRESAGWIARLARVEFSAGRSVQAAAAAPIYVRHRVALTVDERRARAAHAEQIEPAVGGIADVARGPGIISPTAATPVNENAKRESGAGKQSEKDEATKAKRGKRPPAEASKP